MCRDTVKVVTRSPDLEMIRVAYHRNGISGEGFHVILFRDLGAEMPPGTEPRPWGWSPPVMVATVFDPTARESENNYEPVRVAVFDVAKMAAGDVSFGGNSWDGGWYEPVLRAMIDAHRDDEDTYSPDWAVAARKHEAEAASRDASNKSSKEYWARVGEDDRLPEA